MHDNMHTHTHTHTDVEDEMRTKTVSDVSAQDKSLDIYQNLQ